MKKVFCLLLVFAMAISLFAGCGTSQRKLEPASEVSGTEQSSTSSTVAEEPLAEAQTDEPDDSAIVYHGTCGYDASWTLTQNGTLTISGTGKTIDCFTHNTWNVAPWNASMAEKTVEGNEIFPEVVKVIVEEGITELGEGSFHGSPVREIFLPESLKVLGRGAIDQCYSLEKMDIPSGLEHVKAWNFYKGFNQLSNLEEWQALVEEDNKEEISYYSELECVSGEVNGFLFEDGTCIDYTGPGGAVVLPSCLDSDDLPDIMNAHSEIKEITLPDTWKSIGYFGSAGMEHIEKVTIPASIQYIGQHAFMGCKALKTVVFEGMDTEIEYTSFGICENLREVVAPEELFPTLCAASFPSDVFENLMGKRWENDNGLVIYGTTLVEYDGTDAVVHIPDGVTTVGACAFFEKTVTDLYVPDSVTNIGDHAYGFSWPSVSDVCYAPQADVTIHGSSVSAAEEYARRSDINFAAE